MRIVTIGNCQAKVVADCIGSMTDADSVDYYRFSEVADPESSGALRALDGCDLVFAMAGVSPAFLKAAADNRVATHTIPRVFFTAFHPDAIYPRGAAAERRLPLGNCNSALLLHAWREGLNPSQALGLFNEGVYRALGYFDHWDISRQALLSEGAAAGLDMTEVLERWRGLGCFMHQPLHPKRVVSEDISRLVLQRAGLDMRAPTEASLEQDELALNAVWPVYPEIAEHLGTTGDYVFRPKNTRQLDRPDLQPMDLAAFIEKTYEGFAEQPPVLEAFPRLADPRFASLSQFAKTARRQAGAPVVDHPYRNKPAYQFWKKAVTEVPASEVDPMVNPRFKIRKDTAIVTAGSCFAQHIAKALQAAGYRYLVTEDAPASASPAFRREGNYRVFSARYGNVYTARQMLQLVQRAYGDFVPQERVWEHVNGWYVDPFRPEIQEGGFASPQAVLDAQEIHLEAVRRALEQADVFVFTLGMTEAWRSVRDGSIVPLAPGVAKATVAADEYEPANFGIDEVRSDLEAFINRLKGIRPSARVVLTVSPVPIIATFEDQHVLTANTYSKSVLRVAAAEATRAHAHVDYFPSYEIITGGFHRGRYHQEDLRLVADVGVAHVMRVFMKHYTDQAPVIGSSAAEEEISAGMEIVCDEELITAQLDL